MYTHSLTVYLCTSLISSIDQFDPSQVPTLTRLARWSILLKAAVYLIQEPSHPLYITWYVHMYTNEFDMSRR